MSQTVQLATLSLFVALGLAALAVAWAGRRWRLASERRVAALEQAAQAAPAPGAPLALDGLPEPVRRYLDFALRGREGRPIVAARLEQFGEFALRPDTWRPFAATQHVWIRAPGFVWDAAIAMAPFVDVRVRDSYAGQRGSMKASLLGLVALVDQASAELAVASLQRFLAELPWLPTALLPSAALSWKAIDADRSEATLVDGAVSATVEFHFGPAGEIARVTALRSREVAGAMVPTPWEGRFWDYREVEGLRVPHQGEAAWLLPAGRQPYWRARIGRVELRRAEV